MFAAVLAASAADADPRTPLTIAEAEDLALHDEPGLEELRANANELEEQSVAVGQLPDPTLRVGLATYPISGGSFSTEGMTQAQLGIRQAVIDGAVMRVRPVIMTVAATIGGLLPIMFGSGTGSEVMRRIAAPMVGGLLSATILTLIVIPALFLLWQQRQELD